MATGIFRNQQGAWLNVAALSYTLAGYAVGVGLLAASHWTLNVVGVLLVGHTLVYAAYFIHEFAHQTVFRSPQANNRWGTLMSWIAGSCYAPFSALRRKHMRHHTDRADVLTFDYKRFLNDSPGWVRKFVMTLEWLHIPAVEFVMHGYVMLLPFLKAERSAERPRLIAIFLVRIAAFALLGWYSLKALLLYAVAYMIMLHALRFTDAFQHTYDAFAVLEGGDTPNDKVRDRDYEQANTYSNLTSVGRPWLNLLLLNFPYHNAHHERPIVPWHDLPQLHAQLFPADYVQVLPMRELLWGYHRDRVRRVLSDDYGAVGTGPNKADGFLGAVGVSFLTAG